ncbi:MAG: right-handed parallel beta-helix repeat-containing protein [Kiritimatiellae bacterium]|nr:right-handed parallel beta-helix repeat-containing protein [Kiritimatiellia bacterium]
MRERSANCLSAALLSSLLAPCLAPAAWTPPIGIPPPEFGIEEAHTMYAAATFDFGSGPEPYRDAGNGPYTHYVDNSGACTDSGNPFGTAANPRCTFPRDLPAGSVVEVHGGPYNFRNHADKMMVRALGTAAAPVFFRGVSATDRPVFAKTLHVQGRYLILEHLDFDRTGITLRRLIPEGIHHVAIRHMEMHGSGTETGNGGVIGIGMWGASDPTNTFNHIVVYDNHIHDYGDRSPDAENDWLGVGVSGYDAYDAWIVDNAIYNMGGDSGRAGNNDGWDPPPSSHRTYVGRNLMHDNGENAFDVKATHDIVLSQNVMFGFAPSVSDNGVAVVAHYNPSNVWFLNNTIYNATEGIVSSGVVDLYIMGNVIRDVSNGIRFWGTGGIHMVGNTICRADYGIRSAGGSTTAKPVVNNIITDINDPAAGYHIYYDLTGLAANSELRNNLLHQSNGTIRVRWSNVYTSVAALQAGSGKGQGCVEADPQFVNAATNDFHLQPGSLAIDAGMLTPYYQLYRDRFGVDIRKDMDGILRPQGAAWDIGAHEFDGSSPHGTPPAPPANLKVTD